MATQPLSVPRVDDTAERAIARADRREPGLWVSLEERCGERLLQAFLKCANATFTGREAA